MEGESIPKKGLKSCLYLAFIYGNYAGKEDMRVCSFGVHASSWLDMRELDARFYLAHWLGA